MTNPKQPTASGTFLERYRVWILAQPKLLRIFLLPAIVGILGFVVSIYPEKLGDFKMVVVGIIAVAMFLIAYHQHLEAVTFEDFQAQHAESANLVRLWTSAAEKYASIDQTFSSLVSTKSALWTQALAMLDPPNPSANGEFERLQAIAFVRENNCLVKNLQRLVQTIEPFFSRRLDPVPISFIRVAYFVKAQADELKLVCWSSSNHRKPQTETIARTSDTVAAFVWGRTLNEPYIVDDVLKHSHPAPVPFVLLKNKEVRSIFCFRVEDHETSACLGIVCVDSATPGFFTDKLGKEVCNELATAVISRIVYESRFSLMKDALGAYA